MVPSYGPPGLTLPQGQEQLGEQGLGGGGALVEALSQMCAHSPLGLPWLETQGKAIPDRVPVSLGHACAFGPSESSSCLHLLSPGQGGGTTGLPTRPFLPAVETQEPRDWGRPQAGPKRGGHQTGHRAWDSSVVRTPSSGERGGSEHGRPWAGAGGGQSCPPRPALSSPEPLVASAGILQTLCPPCHLGGEEL